ncbi:MAG: nucleotidyltransferase family protein [Candidatus Omnitrophota bacterium]
MKVLILAAGYATRLWPLTLDKPKPLLPIGKKPMLEHILEHIRPLKGVDEVFVVTNSKFVKHFLVWKKNYRFPAKITVVDDLMKTLEDRRGSIGDILFTIDERKIQSNLLVIAGDNIFDFDVDDFMKKAKANSPKVSIGLYDVKNKVLAKQYGIVGLNNNSRVVSFDEKPKIPKSTLAAMCFYYFPRNNFKLLRQYAKEAPSLDLAGNFIRWLALKEPVYGYVFDGLWLDIGDKKSLKKAEKLNW